MAQSKSGQVNAKLEKAIGDMLKEVMDDKKKDAKGNPLYTLTDRCKVIDRALKLEAIKAKTVDGDYGSGFDDDPEDKDD